MADEEKKVTLKEGQTIVDQSMLQQIVESQAKLEKDLADKDAKLAGLEEMFAKGVDTTGDKKLRERKNFEPAFRTLTLKKMPIGGDHENKGIVIGWTNRGAHQKVNREGVAPTLVDYIDVVFLGHEKKDGKLQAEEVPLLALLNAEEITCKVLETKSAARKEPTGEEISVTTFDPKHGLVQTGDVIDGYVMYSDITYVVQIPGFTEPVEIDQKFANA